MRSHWFNKLCVTSGPITRRRMLLLILVAAIALIVILGSSTSSDFDPVSATPVPDIYSNFRRLREQSSLDYLDLRTLSLGSPRQKELEFCGRERENFVPCYNVTANLLAGFKDGEEFDRHCEMSKPRERCLVRTPKDYKIPLRWPAGRDVIWSGNVKISKDQFLSSGSMTKRLMLLEENQIAFHSDDGLIFDGVKDYSRQIAEMIGLASDSEFLQAGVQTVLDIGCGFGSFGAHLVSLNLMPICIAAYEATGSQIQLSLERGLPAMIGNFISHQLPYPALSFDMVHCAQCGIYWDEKGGKFLMEVDRLLRPGGYFVLTSPTTKPRSGSVRMKKTSTLTPIEEFTERICWSLVAQQDETFIWQKTVDVHCYKSRKPEAVPLCDDRHNIPSYYQPLVSCISGTSSKRWIPIQNRSSGSNFDSAELGIHGKYCFKLHFGVFCFTTSVTVFTILMSYLGVELDDFLEDLQIWRSVLKNYWSLLTPLIFSDHPKRPGDEDPLPPYNMIRNVMDMNAHYGSLNAAFLEDAKALWVMNVVPVNTLNTLPLILDRGFAGVLHDWCEPFPTYPRTYDMLHANGLLSHLSFAKCGMIDLVLEMDRILRPEGWVILSDKLAAIEMARAVVTQMHWEARVIDLQNGSDQRLLVCQKPFGK